MQQGTVCLHKFLNFHSEETFASLLNIIIFIIFKIFTQIDETFASFFNIIILNALQNAPSGVKENDDKGTEHDANKPAWKSYKNLPGMPLLCEIPEISCII